MRTEFPYGFVPARSMPSGEYTQGVLSLPESPTWHTTGMLADAHNHCASVMVSNVAQCFASQDTLTRLREIYQDIGDGPVVRAASRGRRSLSHLGIPVHVHAWIPYQRIPAQINKGRPCAILVSKDVRDWHWILCIGWRRYKNNSLWLQVLDGWQQQPRFYYKNVGSRFIFAASFELRNRT